MNENECHFYRDNKIFKIKVGDYDKRVISKTTLPTTPELFRGLIQAIWRKNYQIWLKKNPWTLQKTKSGYLGPPPITQVAKNKCLSLNLGYFYACNFFYIFFEKFCNFFQNSLTPGAQLSGAQLSGAQLSTSKKRTAEPRTVGPQAQLSGTQLSGAQLCHMCLWFTRGGKFIL